MSAPRRRPGNTRRGASLARHFRHGPTDAEKILWSRLRDRQVVGAKFRRQHPVPPYILDFYCHEVRLAVELDGGQHGEDPGEAHDRRRMAMLTSQGISVLRFWNHEVLQDMEMVLENIYRIIVELRGRAEE